MSLDGVLAEWRKLQEHGNKEIRVGATAALVSVLVEIRTHPDQVFEYEPEDKCRCGQAGPHGQHPVLDQMLRAADATKRREAEGGYWITDEDVGKQMDKDAELRRLIKELVAWMEKELGG